MGLVRDGLRPPQDGGAGLVTDPQTVVALTRTTSLGWRFISYNSLALCFQVRVGHKRTLHEI